MQFVVPFGKPRGINRGLDGWARLANYFNRPILETLADASRAQLRVMLEAMNLGDGAKRTTPAWKPKTMTLCLGEHKFLADQLQALVIRRGFRCNVSASAQRTSWHSGEPKLQYRLHIREQTEATVGGTQQRASGFVTRRCQLVETQCDRDEQVWCLKTRLGTLVTRRNGKVAVVGNCGRGFRLHPDKTDCLVLDFGGNVVRHGPVDQIKVKERDGGGGPAPAKECPECRLIIAIGYARCPDCGYEFPPPETERRHDSRASNAGILSGQVTITDYAVSDVSYSVHVKHGASDDDPKSMRVEYKVGWRTFKSEWVCFEHRGYARQKAVAWWKQRSPDPVPDTAERAVEIASNGGIAATKRITVRAVAGEPYERIVGYELGPLPEPLPAELLEFYEEEVPF